MLESYDAAVLVERGGVVRADGSTLKEVFESVCSKVQLPEGVSAGTLVSELMDRESVLSTAVGNGIAIPHPRKPILKSNEDCRVIVAYVNEPIDMNAPDFRKVFAFFILLSDSSQFHIKALSSLAKLFKSDKFKKGIQQKPDTKELVNLINESFS